MKQFGKYAFLFWFGGSFYVTLEVLWRERSHWAMLVLAGFVFITIGLLNQIWGWETGLIKQVLVGTAIATIGEFITGCIVNLWLGWNIWDYSDLKFNLFGQITPQFIALWIPISLLAIVLDDVLRYVIFNEELPRYYIFKKEVELKWLKEWKY